MKLTNGLIMRILKMFLKQIGVGSGADYVNFVF